MTELAGLTRSAAGDMGIGCQWLAPVLRMAAVASGNWPLSARPGGAGWTCYPRLALRTPRPDARSVRAGRDFTIATMRRWGVAERCDDIAVVVSELLTNALRHALPDVGEGPRLGSIRLGLLLPGRAGPPPGILIGPRPCVHAQTCWKDLASGRSRNSTW